MFNLIFFSNYSYNLFIFNTVIHFIVINILLFSFIDSIIFLKKISLRYHDKLWFSSNSDAIWVFEG